MNGFILVYGYCYGCQQPFHFNPHKVPSIRIEGKREPVCAHCMTQINAQRADVGLPSHPIDPQAYAALPEEDL